MRDLETVINNEDVEEFFRTVRYSYVSFLHNFGILALNKYEAEEKMGDVSSPHCLLDLLTANQEAFVVLVVMNNFEGWESRRGQPLDRKHCSGRWTKKTATKDDDDDDDDDDESTATASSKKKTMARKTYQSGYSQEGLQFYEKAVRFFKAVRAHPQGASEGSYYHDVLMHYMAKQNGNRKRKRSVGQQADEMDAADYTDWAEL